jgi:signal peptidase I
MTILLKIAGYLAVAITALFLAVFIAWFTVPRILGIEPQIVLSGSMEPALPTGGVVFVEPVKTLDVAVGDIITFKHPAQPDLLVTHRVTAVNDGPNGLEFHTKGDANNVEDDWVVPASTVVGRVRHSVPYLGRLTNKVKTRSGFLLVIGLPAALIVLGELQNIYREARRRSTNRQAGARNFHQPAPALLLATPSSPGARSRQLASERPPGIAVYLLIIPALLLLGSLYRVIKGSS